MKYVLDIFRNNLWAKYSCNYLTNYLEIFTLIQIYPTNLDVVKGNIDKNILVIIFFLGGGGDNM